MKPFRTFFFIYLFSLLIVSGCATKNGVTRDDSILKSAHRTVDGSLPVVYLTGNPYQLGYQHGYLMRKEIHEQWNQIMSFALSQVPIPLFNRLFIYWKLSRAYGQMEPFISNDYKEEMRGLSEGSAISLNKVKWAHAIPDLYPTLCANGAYFGKATATGQLFHLRNLDWTREMGIHKKACVFVVRPDGRNSFVNFGYAGFIGVLSGINFEGIAVGQIGADTIEYTLRGEPMPLLLRRIIETASDLDTSVLMVEKASRTYGYNYLFSDARTKRAAAIETSSKHFSVFSPNDSREGSTGYGFPREDMIVRSDTAFDPIVRGFQTASGGNPKTAELERPTGKAYETRYKKQSTLAEGMYGSLDKDKLLGIAHEIAPGSNIQSVLFGFPDVWVANAEGDQRAVDCTYHHFNIEELLSGDAEKT